MDSKGVTEVQFNWIFVLFAGALILLFFSTLIVKQKAAAEQGMAAKLLTDIDQLIIDAESSPGLAHSLSFSNFQLEADCTRIASGSIAWNEWTAVFAPRTLKGRNLILWSQAWHAPFKVATFAYMTTDSTKYSIINNPVVDTHLADTLHGGLPTQINLSRWIATPTTFDNPGYFIDQKHASVRLIYINLPPAGLPLGFRNAKSRFTALKITPDDPADGTVGKVTFYEYNKEQRIFLPKGTDSPYLGLPMLYGAIFAEDQAMYDCLASKAFRSLSVVSKTYSYYMHNLTEAYKYPVNAECKDLYNHTGDSPVSFLDEISDTANPPSLTKPPAYTVVQDLGLKIESLATENQNIMEKSCAGIY